MSFLSQLGTPAGGRYREVERLRRIVHHIGRESPEGGTLLFARAAIVDRNCIEFRREERQLFRPEVPVVTGAA